MKAETFLVQEELNVQAVEAAKAVPVDVPQVVPDAVGPVIGELHALALARTPPFPFHPTAEGAARRQGQTLELGQELRAEESRLDRSGHGPRSSSAWK